jgi:hypothetical protein
MANFSIITRACDEDQTTQGFERPVMRSLERDQAAGSARRQGSAADMLDLIQPSIRRKVPR